MYEKTTTKQLVFDFALPFRGNLNPDNRWVKKSTQIPWEYVEEVYRKRLSRSDQGRRAFSGRIAFGSLIIQETLGTTDRETVAQISENPYLQFFLGYEGMLEEEPFDHTMMVAFRKRLSKDVLADINEKIVWKNLPHNEEESEQGDDNQNDNNGSTDGALEEKKDPGDSSRKAQSNKGKLLIDATCTPVDITYPTDLKLLNEARLKTEQIIDCLHEPDIGKKRKPRTYRQIAKAEYLDTVKKKRPRGKTVRKAISKQLGYVRRNLKTINRYAGQHRLTLLSSRLYRLLLVVHEVYRQQKKMYENRTHSISNRIVNLYQPHVRPIVRGKSGVPVEFGPKISVSLVNGFSFLDRLEWEAYNESVDLIGQVETYKERFGFYPKSVHADKIYRTRGNINYCNGNDIRLSGPRLGRPPKKTGENKARLREQRHQRREDEKARMAIAGKFGQGKRRFSLERIMSRLRETSETTIMLSFIVMNLRKITRDIFLYLFFHLAQHESKALKGVRDGERLKRDKQYGFPRLFIRQKVKPTGTGR